MALKLWRKAGEQFLDNDGDPLTAGTLTYYAAGTTDLIDVYMDDDAVASHTNPIDLNSAGLLENPVYIDDGADFKEVISDDGSPLVTQDDYTLNALSGSSPATFSLAKTTVINASDDLTLTTTHRGYEIDIDTTSDDVTVQLDEVADWGNGHHVVLRIVKGANNVVILPVTDELINEAASFTITPDDKWCRVTCTGTAWVADKKNDTEVVVSTGITGDGSSGTPLLVDFAGFSSFAQSDATAKAAMLAMIKAVAPSPDVVIVGYRSQAQGGEASTAGTTARYLNSLLQNRDNIASLSESVFTLPANTYLIEWEAPAYKCDSNQADLYDETNDTTYYGSTNIAAQDLNITGMSRGCAKVTLTEDTDFSIRHEATTANASGFGPAPINAFGLFTKVTITVVA